MNEVKKEKKPEWAGGKDDTKKIRAPVWEAKCVREGWGQTKSAEVRWV